MPVIGMDESLNSLEHTDYKPVRSERLTPIADEAPPPTLGETFKNTLQEHNWVGSLATYGLPDRTKSDPNYSSWSQIKGTKYEPMWEYFVYNDSPEETQKTMRYLDESAARREILSRASTVDTLISGLGAGILDPLNLIPIAGVVNKGSMAYTIGKSALVGAGAVAGLSAADEVLLHASQPHRTFKESVINTAAGAALGGLIGAGVGAVASRSFSNSEKQIAAILNTGEPEFHPDAIKFAEQQSVNAAKYVPEFNDATVAGFINKNEAASNIALKAVQVPYLNNPWVEGLTSSSPTTRSLTAQLFDVPLRLTQHYEGKTFGPSVESKIRYDMTETYKTLKEMDKEYLHYLDVKEGKFSGFQTFFKGGSDGKLNGLQFREEVGRAMRGGDIHSTPEIENAAKVARTAIDNLTKKMQKLEILPEDLELKGDTSYLTRIWKVPEVMARRSEFENIATKGIIEHKLVSPDADIGETVEQAARRLASEWADSIVGIGDKQIGLSELTRMSLDKGVRFTKERGIDLPSSYFDDFLVNDAHVITQAYMNQANQMIRVKELFDRLGVDGPSGIAKLLKTERDDMVSQLVSWKTAKEKHYRSSILDKDILDKKLSELKIKSDKVMNITDTDLKKNLDLANDLIKMTLGQYAYRSKADSFFRNLRSYNYLTKLGGVLISSITDTMMPIVRYGIGDTLLEGWGSKLKTWIAGHSAMKRQDLIDLGNAIDSEMESALKILYDGGFEDDFVKSKAGQIADLGTGVMSHLTGMTWWNKLNRRVDGTIVENVILRTLKKGDFNSLSKADQVYLLDVGINPDFAKRIKIQQEKWGFDLDGTHFSNVSKWNDEEARMVFSTAISKEVQSMSIMTGKGDTPRVVQKYQAARTLYQFKPFFSAMTSRILLAGLQRHDTNTLMAVTGLIGLGALQYIIRNSTLGRKSDTSAPNLLVEGINRSGIGGVMLDPMFAFILNPIMRKAGYGNFGTSRFTNSNPVEYLFGPSAGLVKDLASLSLDTATLSWDENTLKKARHLIPFQNLFYLDLLFKKLGWFEGKKR